MIELIRSNDPVELSWVQSILADEGIESLIFDYHASILDGSIGALPRRLMVTPDDESRARYVLEIARRDLGRDAVASSGFDDEGIGNDDLPG